MPILNDGFEPFRNISAANKTALKAMGHACMQVAKPLCPVQTGNLKNSHRVVVSGDHVDVGVTAHYGSHVHNGTTRQTAQPWLKDAAEANRNSIMQVYIDTMARELGQ
jgi:HK97 gp10 family phage protein